MASIANKNELLEKIQDAKKNIESLKGQIESIRSDKSNQRLYQSASRNKLFSSTPNTIKSRRVLRGHFGKIYSCSWSGDSVHLVSASQDGKLIVWNGVSENKVQSIPLTSSWVITCAYEQSVNRLVASGGMDNICTIYRVDKTGGSGAVRVTQELVGHLGYLSSVHFVSERVILTASGDSTCSCWDIERGKPTANFKDHKADVMSLSGSNIDANIFASGSVDSTCKIWDIRTGKSVLTFRGHSSDVNSVTFFPDGNAIGTGSDDTSCRIFDMRCASELGAFGTPQILSGITSVSFSSSGRFLFAGYEDNHVRAWDVTADPAKGCMQLGGVGHEGRVSTVAVNPTGDALLTGSWDTFLRIWA